METQEKLNAADEAQRLIVKGSGFNFLVKAMTENPSFQFVISNEKDVKLEIYSDLHVRVLFGKCGIPKRFKHAESFKS